MKETYTLKLEGKEWKDCLESAFNKKKKDINKYINKNKKLTNITIKK